MSQGDRRCEVRSELFLSVLRGRAPGRAPQRGGRRRLVPKGAHLKGTTSFKKIHDLRKSCILYRKSLISIFFFTIVTNTYLETFYFNGRLTKVGCNRGVYRDQPAEGAVGDQRHHPGQVRGWAGP